MTDYTSSPFLVPFDNSFELSKAGTSHTGSVPDDDTLKKQLKSQTKKIATLQNKLYAHNQHSLLLIFQAMDAAGKDSTIRAITQGINPAGFQVYSFKQPSKQELDHDFLWRSACSLPERGRIGIFNRSYYEEVLVVKVHPEYLPAQQLPTASIESENFWHNRYESIRSHEQHLANNGTTVLKFWLNVSKAEQKDRFLSRLSTPEKVWKFSSGDIKERGYWKQYMSAYETALNETSRACAPWYAIPADDKKFMRQTVSDIVLRTLERLPMSYPTVSKEKLEKYQAIKQQLLSDD